MASGNNYRVAPPAQNPIKAIVALVIFGGLAWFFFGGGLEQQAARDMDRIESQVADDAVKQYNIAKRGGSAMDACVQAGMVSAAYLQAQNSGEYERWKQTETADCRAAGLPR